MERTFRTKTKFYNERKIYKRGSVTIKPGITVLVGCNGAGKSTLLTIIQESLSEDDVPYFVYNNLTDGGTNAISYAFASNDSIGLGATLICSSEGERITLTLNHKSSELVEFVKTGREKKSNLFSALWGKEQEPIETKERWIIFDAIDSGLSVDQIADAREYLLDDFYKQISEAGYDVHIIVSTNSYELCKGEQCLDVIEGQYVGINSYEDYLKVVMKSRKYKERMNEKYLQEIEEKGGA